jgi:hypothetical protein
MPNLGVVTITRPDSDVATYLGKLALSHAIDYMKNKGLTVDDLSGDNAIRTKVLESLSRNDPISFMGCGHGNSTTFTGQRLSPIWWSCDCKELKGRVVYLLSCLTGQNLGPDMVNNKGAWCYIGYKVTFTWVQEKLIDPLLDKYAKSFFEPVLEIIERLADGKTTGEAFKASIERWNYWIDYWSKSNDRFASLVVSLLKLDRDGQVLIGDENARIVSVVTIPWFLLMAVGASAPVGAVIGVVGTEELKKAGIVK